jgi:hypothetical protein
VCISYVSFDVIYIQIKLASQIFLSVKKNAAWFSVKNDGGGIAQSTYVLGENEKRPRTRIGASLLYFRVCQCVCLCVNFACVGVEFYSYKPVFSCLRSCVYVFEWFKSDVRRVDQNKLLLLLFVFVSRLKFSRFVCV